MGTKPQMVKVPAEVLALLQTLLRAALLDRPTKEQADAAYLARDTTYIQTITPTEGGIKISDSKGNETEIAVSPTTDLATFATNGLMSAEDKAKLDSIDPYASNYTLPTATANTLGGVKIGQNVNINGGAISVNDAGANQAGVTRLYNTTNGSHADGAITQAAVAAALTLVNTAITSLDNRVTDAEGKLTSIYRYKGSVASYEDLPKTFLAVGDTYNVETADDEHGINAGDNVAWTGSEWDVLHGFVDLSELVSKSGGTIDGDLTVNGNLNVTGKISGVWNDIWIE